MKYTTIGELIEVLQQYPMDTPVLKQDPAGPGYHELTLTGRMQFRVVAAGTDEYGENYYIDGPDGLTGFLAVAL